MPHPSDSRAYLPFALACGATALLLIGTLYFASLRPEYSHLTHTISELGEAGDPNSGLVSYGLFLTAGLMVWASLLLAYLPRPGGVSLRAGLFAFSSLGFGYVVAAFFPCDPGAPPMGSWRTHAHNFGGFVEYFGASLGLGWLAIRSRGDRPAIGVGLMIAAGVVMAGLVMLSLPAFLPVRGAVQRVAEITLFASLCALCHPTVAQRLSDPPARH